MQLHRAAAGHCSGPAALLKLSSGFALMPAADGCTVTISLLKSLTKWTGEWQLEFKPKGRVSPC